MIAETATAEKTVMKSSVSHATCRDRNGHDYHDHGGNDADDTEEEDADHDRRHQSRSVSHHEGHSAKPKLHSRQASYQHLHPPALSLQAKDY